jgi:hypothetical protein
MCRVCGFSTDLHYICYGTHWSLGKLTGRWAISVPNNRGLWVLGKVGGRYEGSVWTIKVIDWKKKSMFAMEPIGRWATWLVVGQFQCPSTGVMSVGQSRWSVWGVSGDQRSHWLKEKANVCYGTHWSLGKLTCRWAILEPNNGRLWVLGKVGGRFEGSVGTIEVIDWNKKSMFAIKLIGRCENWLVVGQFQCQTTGDYECWAKSAVAMRGQWGP